MAMRFPTFQPAAQAAVPSYVNAELARARIDSANKARKYRQQQQLLGGGTALYNEMMGDETPIRDSVMGLVDELRGGGGGVPEDAAWKNMAGGNMGMGGQTGAAVSAADAAGAGADYSGMAGGNMGASAVDAAMSGADAGGAAATAADAAMSSAEALPEYAEMAGGAMGAAEAGADAASGASGMPLVGALKGGSELLNGDIGSAAQTGAQTYLATLGPYGIAASLLLGLMG